MKGVKKNIANTKTSKANSKLSEDMVPFLSCRKMKLKMLLPFMIVVTRVLSVAKIYVAFLATSPTPK
jgi:hypothetical protein